MTRRNQRHPLKSEEAVKQLDFASWRKLEFALGFKRAELKAVAAKAGSYYAPFPKQYKKRPFQKKFKPVTKQRIIDNPLNPLKEIQKRLNRRLLRVVQLPDFFYGGVAGKSLRDNIQRHLGARTLVTLDIANFYPSVKPHLVYKIWRDTLGCSPEIAGVLTQLTTFQRKLPQGASTSTTLANLVVALQFDSIRKTCEAASIQYSTWIDDLAFSGTQPQAIITVVVAALRRAGLQLSRRKLRIMGPGERKVLNNNLLGKTATVAPTTLAQIRAGIHKLELQMIAEESISDYIRELKGRILYVRSINNSQGEKLMGRLREALARAKA